MATRSFLLCTFSLLVAGSTAMVLREELLAVADCYKVGCPRIYDPVCGSDGKTYGSPCRFRQAACIISVTDPKAPELTIVHKGKCNPEPSPLVEEQQAQTSDADTCYQAPCTFIYMPVCASDGKTYPNECVFGQALCALSVTDASAPELTVVSQGQCPETEEDKGAAAKKEEQQEQQEEVVDITTCYSIACPRMYAPVCGSDGKTYSNICVLAKAACVLSVEDPAGPELTIDHKGECGSTDEEPEPVPQLIETKPKKEQNEGEEEVSKKEEAVDITECQSTICPRLYLPVCGSDGKTYPNLCLLAKAACIASVENPSAPELTVASKGECETSDDITECQSTICPRLYLPVCGSDGKTYPNLCLLAKAACIASVENPSGPELIVVSKGECESSDQEPEPVPQLIETKPKKEQNEEEEEVAKKEEQQQQEETIDITECQSTICPRLYLPVCGSDGKTYPNLCLLAKAACIASVENPSGPELTVASKGECESGDPVPQLIETKPKKEQKEEVAKKEEQQQQEEAVDISECQSTICPRLYLPVCGSDGKTYPNLCLLAKAACIASVENPSTPELTVASKGECDSSEPVPQLIETKPKKEQNEEEEEVAKKEEQQQQEEAVDITECQSTICPRLYLPVCGSDGKTYPNLCLLAKAACIASVENPSGPELTVASKGECDSSEPVPQLIETKPKKEQKEEVREVAKKEEQQQEAVDFTECKSTICPRLYLPVCGSDGKTYPNFCLLAKAACIASVENPSGPELTIASKGECGSSDPVPQLISSKPEIEQQEQEEPAVVTSCFKPGCPRIYLPVCGSDGKTYSNTCLFQQAACASRMADPTAPELTIVSKGRCDEQEEQQQRNKLQKAIDDVAHLLRQLEAEEPRDQQEQTEDPVLACLEKVCGRQYLPVCASDGKTYHNTCLMDQASCVLSAVQPDAPAITAEYIGECGNPWPVTS